MTTLDQHAERLISFHKKLTDGGMPDDAASVITIDLSKSLLATENVTDTPVTKADVRDAGEQKRRERDERLRES